MQKVTRAVIIALVLALLVLASDATISALKRGAAHEYGPAQSWPSSYPHRTSSFLPLFSPTSTDAIPTA